MKSSIFVILLSTTILCPAAFSKQLDMANQSDPDGTYFLAFCARNSPGSTGKPGHAFVSFSEVSNTGQRKFLSIGHTIASGIGEISATWSYFGAPVVGYLKEENYTAISQSCLDIKVNKDDYDRAIELTKSPLQLMGILKPEATVFEAYKLGANDCMTFMRSVASVLISRGLKVPTRGTTELPLAYIARFISEN